MPAKSPGNNDRGLRKSKSETLSRKKHTFEPFTRRIARLKIDPVHSVQSNGPSGDASDLSQSFFRTALEEWAELNLSTTFTSFLNNVNPLCENLPQLLHYRDRIFDALVQNIEKKDELALEPLLSLMACLAHDLGQQFEIYFSRSVSVVAQVAAAHSTSDVIEWCFNCLAWMFRHLSKLLVQDLRPLLAIMKPYLSHRKDYIARFSAESLAFLLRKAAVLYSKQQTPLTLALTSLLQPDDGEDLQAQHGPMSLIVESCLGVESGLHSSATNLVQGLFYVAADLSFISGVQSLVEGVLVNIIHRTNAAGARPIISVLLKHTQVAQRSSDTATFSLMLILLQAALATRSGTRIEDWRLMLENVVTMSSSMQSSSDASHLRRLLLSSSSLCLQYAPMDQLLPFSTPLLDSVVHNYSAVDFFAYCTLTAELEPDRFHDLLLARLQRYLTSNLQKDDFGLLCLLQKLQSMGVISRQRGHRGYLESSRAWDSEIIQRLNQGGSGDDQAYEELLSQVACVSHTINFPLEKDTARALSDALTSRIITTLEQADDVLDFGQRITLGWVFAVYVEVSSTTDGASRMLMRAVAKAPAQCFRLLPFLEALVRLGELKENLEYLHGPHFANPIEILVQNLLNCSKEMRKASLLVISRSQGKEHQVWLSDTVHLLLEISEIGYTPATVRTIAMLLRRLPHRQKCAPSDRLLQQLVPHFCLGLLSSYHEQTRKDVCIALREVIEDSSTQETVVDILTTWLRSPPTTDKTITSVQATNNRPSPFECTNLNHVRTAVSHAFEFFKSPKERLRSILERAHCIENPRMPYNARGLALQALSEIATLTEKRSRQITPIFLAAQLGRTSRDSLEQSDTSVSSHTLSPDIAEKDWSFPDRRAFVSLFGYFQNPRVLYRSAEVYEKLLDLLSNGNADIRKLSLTAILKWKDPVLLKHERILFQVIEEKIANAEIGLMLNAESEENPVQTDERPIVLPVLLRLLYGLIMGRSGTNGSQEARRKSVLRMLFRMDESEVLIILNIGLGRLKDLHFPSAEDAQSELLDQQLLPSDQQYGFLRLILSLMETLQSQFEPYGKYVMEAVLYCTLTSCRRLQKGGSAVGSIFGNIRRTGLQCLIFLFGSCHDLDWSPFMRLLFAEAISPRLENFAVETAQGTSGLLRLFSTWTQSTDYIRYLDTYDPRLLPASMQILSIQSAKSEVKVFVLNDIIAPLVQLARDSTFQPNSAMEILSTRIPSILQHLGSLLLNTPTKEILMRTTSILTDLGSFAASSGATSSITRLLVDVLATSRQQLSPQARSGVLSAIYGLLQPDLDAIDPLTRDKLFEVISRLFNYFKDSGSRQSLCNILQCLEGRFDAKLAIICADLNALSVDKLDEVDFDRRSRAFSSISSLQIDDESAQRWLPILYNLLFFMRDEEFSIRSNAVTCLKEFIVAASARTGDTIRANLTDVLLPVLQEGVKEDSEAIRADAVMLYGLLVQHVEDLLKVQDMKVLLVGNDEEASFFTNILHVQQHRRIRAIRRLVAEVERGAITAQSIAHFFLPLLLKFIRDASTDDSVQGARGESFIAIRTLLQWIDWKQYKSLFKRFKSELQSEQVAQRISIKLLVHATDALVLVHKSRVPTRNFEESVLLSHLARSLPPEPDFAEEVKAQFLPKLADFAHHKDEAEMSLRLPVATTAIKLTSLLPMNETRIFSAPIVLDVANILRSRAQESRDAARSALKEMIQILGPGSLRFVLAELRSVLKRGYQLHVLSFTLHAVLVELAPTLELGDLDYCLDDMVSVVVDDIFGLVGQEKESQDYISSMKEVKSSKSFDSMELIARSASLDNLKYLIEPIVTILTGTLNAKQTRHVDELLRRIGAGLSRNPAAENREILVFAYQAIQSFYRERKATVKPVKTIGERSKERFLIQLSSSNNSESLSSSPLLYKIARFAIDLVRSALQKHDELLTAENVHGFLPIIGDALVEAQEDVKMSSLRLLSAIIKLRMPELDQNAPIYVREAVKVIQSANSTNDEAAQAALKLIAAVLRERKSVQVRTSDIADLLRRITPDLEEPDRQGVSFNFVRAVMSRKFQVPEVYDLVDKIGVMMVTNTNRGARDTARGIYIHFLLDYPQSSIRWTKQQKFLIKNLEYDYPEGRESVMEAINMLLNKTAGDVRQQLISAFFVAIVLRMANEDHDGCRELAGALLGHIFEKAEPPRRKGLLQPLEAWVEQTENPPLTKLAMQAFGVLFDAVQDELVSQVILVRDAIETALKSPASEEGDLPGEALRLLSKLADTHPSKVMTQKSSKLWQEVRSLLRHPFPSIQRTATLLVGSFLRSCKPENAHKLSLTSSYGLSWDEDAIRDVLKASARIIKRSSTSADLHEQIMPVLLFLGRCLDTNGLTVSIKSKANNEAPDPSSEAADSDSDTAETPSEVPATSSIPAIHYLLHQLILILRRETPSPTTSSLLPKSFALNFLSSLLPNLQASTLTPTITQPLLLPLIHLTSPTTYPPRSPDPAFSPAYTALTTAGQELMGTLQEKLGDKVYVKMMTEASKVVRERREERRRKRVIGKVAEPERAAQAKRRKEVRKGERRKELRQEWGSRRRGRGW